MIERPSLSLSLSLVFFFVDPFKLPAATDPSNVLISRLPRPNFAEFAPTRSVLVFVPAKKSMADMNGPSRSLKEKSIDLASHRAIV